MHLPVEGQDSKATPGRAFYVALLSHAADRDATVAERAALASYVEFVVRDLYHKGYAEAMLAMPDGPADVGHNTVRFTVARPGLWQYSRMTWHSPLPQPPGGLPLGELLDQVQGYGPGSPSPKWEAWKAAHPDVFDPTVVQ